MSEERLVYIVDDDAAVRSMLVTALTQAGFTPLTFASAEELLENEVIDADRAGCVLIDVELPGMDGSALQKELLRRGIELPVVIISGQADVPTAVQMMRNGAIDLLQKPFPLSRLVQRLQQAFEQQADRLQEREHHQRVQQRLAGLSNREQDVLREILGGKSNKQISASLDVGIQTVAKHKARILRKLAVRNDLELLLLLTGAGGRPGV